MKVVIEKGYWKSQEASYKVYIYDEDELIMELPESYGLLPAMSEGCKSAGEYLKEKLNPKTFKELSEYMEAKRNIKAEMLVETSSSKEMAK